MRCPTTKWSAIRWCVRACSPTRGTLPNGHGGADRTLIAIAEDGTRAFVATTDLKRSCLRVVPLRSSDVVDAPSACAFEVDGWVRGLGAVSDHEVLLLVTEGDNEPTYRLLRVRDL